MMYGGPFGSKIRSSHNSSTRAQATRAQATRAQATRAQATHAQATHSGNTRSRRAQGTLTFVLWWFLYGVSHSNYHGSFPERSHRSLYSTASEADMYGGPFGSFRKTAIIILDGLLHIEIITVHSTKVKVLWARLLSMCCLSACWRVVRRPYFWPKLMALDPYQPSCTCSWRFNGLELCSRRISCFHAFCVSSDMFFYPDSLSFSVQKYNFLRSSGTSRSSRISRQDWLLCWTIEFF